MSTSASTAASAGVSEVIVARKFKVANLSYAQPKKLNTGGTAIYINYSGGVCYLQTPWMKAPFGVKVWPSENGGPDKINMDLSFEGRETNEELRVFYEALESIDKRLVKDAMDNSQLWFKKKFASDEVVRELYTPTIRYSKDKDTGEINTRYAPTFKTTLPKDKEGRFNVTAFGDKREELDLNEVISSGRCNGARVQAIVQLSSIWMVGGKFGVSWKVKQMRISESSRLGNSFAFVKTEGDEEEEDDFGGPAPTVVRRLPGGAPGPSSSVKGIKKEEEEEGVLPESDEEKADDEGLEP